MAVRALLYAAIGVSFSIAPLISQSNPSQQEPVESHARRAQDFLKNNQPDLAAREYEAILALNADNADARGNLGVVRFFQGDYTKAIPELRRALQLRPALWKIQALLGMAEKRTGDTLSARTDLDHAFPQLREEKLRVETGMELIELYYGSNELEKAAAIVSELKRLEPTNIEILYTSHQIYGELADESMLSVGMLAPKSARMHQLMAHEMARQGDTQGAIAQFRQAVKTDPQRPGLRFELAEMLTNSANRADQDEAEQEYKAALAANPFDERAERRLGDIAARHSDLKDAYAHYSRALQLQPEDADADLGLAKTLIAMNEPGKAQPLLEHSAQLDPFNVVTRYHLAAIYRRLGRADDARRELAEFQKLKDMKQQLREVYKEMRVEPAHQERPDPEVPN
ncbi:MAG TPA: tetratricopeptide repeat protein [Bryobacteraceae bacterium]|nr:tetratricopeptide repeat protein [Bryobacteraceae bacterium]